MNNLGDYEIVEVLYWYDGYFTGYLIFEDRKCYFSVFDMDQDYVRYYKIYDLTDELVEHINAGTADLEFLDTLPLLKIVEW